MMYKKFSDQKLFPELRLAGFLLLLATFSCHPATQDPDKQVKYAGPIMETADVHTLYSDSARIKIKLNAPLQQQFENGDGVYPKGIDLVFLDDNGKVSTTLRANYGKYEKETDAYHVRGNVVVKNIIKNETLNTEELHWDKRKQQIHTDKFVKIRTAEEILTGTGLEANQDFSRYKILKPSGIFSVKE
jgi:LPS export ABC transporter protein LptC